MNINESHDDEESPDPGTITALLIKMTEGDEEAMNLLFSHIYPYLRRKAMYELNREKPGHTLQATDLVHEAYLRLVNQDRLSAENRTHFFSICGRSMRRILVEYARSKGAQKRGGDVPMVKIHDLLEEPGKYDSQTLILSLNLALEKLEEIDPIRVKLVEMRLFAGLTLEEAAAALDISYAKAQRSWKATRLWLQDLLDSE